MRQVTFDRLKFCLFFLNLLFLPLYGKILNPAQNSFRSGKSTNTALLSIINEISNAIDSNEAATLCLLNFKKDLVDRNILLRKLRDFNLSSSTLTMFESYLTN